MKKVNRPFKSGEVNPALKDKRKAKKTTKDKKKAEKK